jgi:flagellar biosynthesis GTPase FlhF
MTNPLFVNKNKYCQIVKGFGFVWQRRIKEQSKFRRTKRLKKLMVGILLIVCSFSAAVRTYGYREAYGPARYQPVERSWQAQDRWQDAERRRQEEERRRQEEERRRKEEDRRQQEERRRQQEERRRQQEERRRQQEDRRQQEERRRQEEDRRQQEERRRQEENRRQSEIGRRPGGPPPFHHVAPDRDFRWKFKAGQVLHETANYLVRAQRAARFGPYRYGLGKAYAHQEEARNLYFDGQYRRAIDHSLRARKIAQYIIMWNKPGYMRRPGRHAVYNDPIDNELSIKVVDDKIAIRLKINLD